TFARGALTEFEVSEGHKVLQDIAVTALQGAGGGAAFGLLFGWTFSLIRGNPAPCQSQPGELLACLDYDFAKDLADPVEQAKFWGVTGLVGGIIAGAIQATSEHWAPAFPLGVK